MEDLFVAIFRKCYVPQALFTKIYFTPGYLPYRNSFPYASGDTTLCNYKKTENNMFSNTGMDKYTAIFFISESE